MCKRVAISRAFPGLAKQFLTNAAAEVKDFWNKMCQNVFDAFSQHLCISM